MYKETRKQWTFGMLQYIGFGLFHKKEQKSLLHVQVILIHEKSFIAILDRVVGCH